MADKPIKLLKTVNGESFYPRVATGNEKGVPFDGEEGAKLVDKVEQLQTSVATKLDDSDELILNCGTSESNV